MKSRMCQTSGARDRASAASRCILIPLECTMDGLNQPPLVPAVAWLVSEVIGPFAWALRILPALAGASSVMLAGLMARELGAGRGGQTVATVATATSVELLALFHLLSTAAFDGFFWALVTWLTLRMLRTADDRWMVALGAVTGWPSSTSGTWLSSSRARSSAWRPDRTGACSGRRPHWWAPCCASSSLARPRVERGTPVGPGVHAREPARRELHPRGIAHLRPVPTVRGRTGGGCHLDHRSRAPLADPPLAGGGRGLPGPRRLVRRQRGQAVLPGRLLPRALLRRWATRRKSGGEPGE